MNSSQLRKSNTARSECAEAVLRRLHSTPFRFASNGNRLCVRREFRNLSALWKDSASISRGACGKPRNFNPISLQASDNAKQLASRKNCREKKWGGEELDLISSRAELSIPALSSWPTVLRAVAKDEPNFVPPHPTSWPAQTRGATACSRHRSHLALAGSLVHSAFGIGGIIDLIPPRRRAG